MSSVSYRAIAPGVLYVLVVCASCQAGAPPPQDSVVTGVVIQHADFASQHVDSRNIDVWLPPGYEESSSRYPVLYMHDGQHLYDASRNGERVEGNLDETMTALIDSGKVEPAIIVGIWNTPKRTAEYMPWAWARELPDHELDELRTMYGDLEQSDKYLRFIVEELKPFIDQTYRTRPDRESTFVMGISMGGLISLYAATEYPEVFGGAGCVSTHWPIVGAPIAYLEERIGEPARQIFYFDYGTEHLDAEYEPYQMRVDSLMRVKGYSADSGWITRKYEGADHSWPAWSTRFHVPLTMFFGRS